MASSDAKPVPQKNVAYRITFPILDADGDLVTGAATLDSEISKDGGTFADCTNEATEIATSSGMYYLDLTSTEMNADTVAIIVKTGTAGAKTTPIVMYPEEAGDIRVNVTAYGGTAGTFSSGRPEVNTSHIAGSAVSTSSAQIGVNVVNAGGTAWGSGAITAASIAADAITAAKIADGAIDAGAIAADAITAAKIAAGAIDAATFAADTGLVPARSNTAQTGAAGSVTLDASASATTDFYVGMWVYLTGGTGAGQARVVTAYDGTTKVATIAPNWATNPDVTSTFAVVPAAHITGVQGNVTGSVASVTGAVGSVTGNVGGNVTGSVGSVATGGIAAASFAAGAINAAAIATDAIDSDAIAASAVTELQSGLSTLDAAGIRTAVGLASANLDTQLGDLPTAVENADALLGRNVAGGSSAGRLVKEALYLLRNKTAVAAGTLTVYATDDTTSVWTAAVGTTAGDPISSVDPA